MCKEEESERPTSVQLFAEDVHELREQQRLIESQELAFRSTEHILIALRKQMEQYIADHYGIDVVQGAWELDLQAGVLQRKES